MNKIKPIIGFICVLLTLFMLPLHGASAAQAKKSISKTAAAKTVARKTDKTAQPAKKSAATKTVAVAKTSKPAAVKTVSGKKAEAAKTVAASKAKAVKSATVPAKTSAKKEVAHYRTSKSVAAKLPHKQASPRLSSRAASLNSVYHSGASKHVAAFAPKSAVHYTPRSSYPVRHVASYTPRRTYLSKPQTYSTHANYAPRYTATAYAPRTAYRAQQSSPLNAWSDTSPGRLALRSAYALVQDQSTGKILYEKHSGHSVPIASITKLMTAMVVLDSQPDLDQYLTISESDVDTVRRSSSRLPVGTVLSREELLRLALMSSENRAASALARYYPGGRSAFVRAMNNKAMELGMYDTFFYDSTGLNAGNVSTARDLARMVAAASNYSLIHQMTTTATHDTYIGERFRTFNNTNSLVKNPDWNIDISKTGYIKEAGKCIAMKAWIGSKPTIIVLLHANGSSARIADAMHIKDWMENTTYASRADQNDSFSDGSIE